MDMSIQANLGNISFSKSLYAKKHYGAKLPSKVNELMYGFTGNFCFEVKKLVEDLGLIQQAGNCHFNVLEHVREFGGKAVNGWLLGSSGKETKNGMWVWSFHSIWETAEGLWIDVTVDKHNENKNRTVFCEDKYRKINLEKGISYNNIFMLSSNSFAEKYTEYIGTKINNREIYWSNDDFSIFRTLNDHSGQYYWLGKGYSKNLALLKEKYNIFENEDGTIDQTNIKGNIEDALFDFSLRR